MSKPVGTKASQKSADNTQKTTEHKRHPAPARSIESRENQLVNLAVSLAEKQLRAGTASSQVITHYLKLGTTYASLEREKLKNENLLLAAKTEALKSSKKIEELYINALTAMGIYSGTAPVKSGEDDED